MEAEMHQASAADDRLRDLQDAEDARQLAAETVRRRLAAEAETAQVASTIADMEATIREGAGTIESLSPRNRHKPPTVELTVDESPSLIGIVNTAELERVDHHLQRLEQQSLGRPNLTSNNRRQQLRQRQRENRERLQNRRRGRRSLTPTRTSNRIRNRTSGTTAAVDRAPMEETFARIVQAAEAAVVGADESDEDGTLDLM